MYYNRVSKGVFAACAVAAAGIFLHWALFHPALIDPRGLRVPMFVDIILGAPGSSPASPLWFRNLNLALIALVGMLAAGLSLFILFKSQVSAATLRLAGALSLAPLSTAFFFFLATHGTYRVALGLDDSSAALALATFAAYAAGLVGACLLVRFFLAYPRAPNEQELLAFYRKLNADRIATVNNGWRKRLFGRLIKPSTRVVDEAWNWKFFRGPWAIVAAIAFAAYAAGVDFYVFLPEVRDTKSARVLLSSAAAINFMSFVVAIEAAFQGLLYHHREAIADDRARIEWIYGALVAAALILAAVPPLWWGALVLLLPTLEPSANNTGAMMFAGPLLVGFELFLLTFVVSLALSIFYRGAVDPRLAMRRLSIFGLMSLVIAVLFVVLERAAAIKLVAWLSLPQEAGTLIAAGAIASLAPVRNTVQRGLTGFVSRFLPLEAIVDGERKEIAVVISDISGYTALSARDEKQAMLLAALLQRQAVKISEPLGGRMVKSMGDAVILAFPSAESAVRAMDSLHREFATGSAALGVEVLPMHSGAHFGEVTETHDGDIYGQTVNIAARLLSLAAAGQRVVSAELVVAAGMEGPTLRSLGPKQLKNVPQPVDCHEVVEA